MPNPECPNRMCSHGQTGRCFHADHVHSQAESGGPGASNLWGIEKWNNFIFSATNQAKKSCLTPEAVRHALLQAQELIHFLPQEENLLARPDHTPFCQDSCKFVHLKTTELTKWTHTSGFVHPPLPAVDDLVLIDYQEVYHLHMVAIFLGLDYDNLALRDTLRSVPCYNAGFLENINGRILIYGGSGELRNQKGRNLDAGRLLVEMRPLHSETLVALKKIYPDLIK